MHLPLIKALIAVLYASAIAIGAALAPSPSHNHRSGGAVTVTPAKPLLSDAIGFLAQLEDGLVRPDPALTDRWKVDVTAVARSLGISGSELARELNRGRSLTQIAASHRVDAATPRAVLLRRVRKDFDRAEHDKSISTTAANALLDALTAALGHS